MLIRSVTQRAKPATRKEMAQFHTDEYVDFLSRVSPDLVDAAAESGAAGGGAGGRAGGIGREMGKCEWSFSIGGFIVMAWSSRDRELDIEERTSAEERYRG